MKKLLQPTYIYALLIFIGYYNNFQYYSFFDIEISNYLTFGELLMSFMPLTVFLLFVISLIAFFVVMSIISIVLGDKKADEYDDGEDDDINSKLKSSYKEIKDIIKEKKWKSFNTYALLFINIIQFVLSLASIIFIILYIIEFLNVIFDKKTFFGLNRLTIFILGFIWLGLFDNLISKKLKEQRDLRISAISTLSFLFLLGIISVGNRQKARDILNGKPDYFVNFKIGKETVKTDTSLVYVGQTEKYFFIRDLSERKNKIYPMDKLELIEMIKIDSKSLTVKKDSLN